MNNTLLAAIFWISSTVIIVTAVLHLYPPRVQHVTFAAPPLDAALLAADVGGFRSDCTLGSIPPGTEAVLASIRVMPATPPQPRVLCAVLGERPAAAPAWHARCDQVVFASDLRDVASQLDRFDWVAQTDASGYYVIENLRFYLRSPEITRFQPRLHHVLLGRFFDLPYEHVWNITGPNAVMSSSFVRGFLAHVERKACRASDMITCMRYMANDITVDSRDEFRRHRFHVEPHPTSLDACSDRTIAFSGLTLDDMSDYEAMLYRCRLPKSKV